MTEWELYWPHIEEMVTEKIPYNLLKYEDYECANRKIFYPAFQLGMKALTSQLVMSSKFRDLIKPEDFYDILQEIAK